MIKYFCRSRSQIGYDLGTEQLHEGVITLIYSFNETELTQDDQSRKDGHHDDVNNSVFNDLDLNQSL